MYWPTHSCFKKKKPGVKIVERTSFLINISQQFWCLVILVYMFFWSRNHFHTSKIISNVIYCAIPLSSYSYLPCINSKFIQFIIWHAVVWKSQTIWSGKTCPPRKMALLIVSLDNYGSMPTYLSRETQEEVFDHPSDNIRSILLDEYWEEFGK